MHTYFHIHFFARSRVFLQYEAHQKKISAFFVVVFKVMVSSTALTAQTPQRLAYCRLPREGLRNESETDESS